MMDEDDVSRDFRAIQHEEYDHWQTPRMKKQERKW
jgi:hypothetical protein